MYLRGAIMKAGLFSGEITSAAPANGAATTKQNGYQWMQWGGEIPPPPTEYLFLDYFNDANGTALQTAHTPNIDINPTTKGWSTDGSGSQIIDNECQGLDAANNAWCNAEESATGLCHMDVLEFTHYFDAPAGIYFRCTYTSSLVWPIDIITRGYLIAVDDIDTVSPKFDIFLWNGSVFQSVASTSMAAEGSVAGLPGTIEVWGDINTIYGSVVVNGNTYNVELSTTDVNTACIYGSRTIGTNAVDNFWIEFPPAATPVPYSPLKMTFNGSSYYTDPNYNAHSYRGGTYTCCFNVASFTGVDERVLIWNQTAIGNNRVVLTIGASNAGQTLDRNRVIATVYNQSNAIIARIVSETEVTGAEHAIHFTHDTNYGWARLTVDGKRESQAGGSSVAPIQTNEFSTGTFKASVGADINGANGIVGQIGWVGIDDHVTNGEYFFVNDQPKEINEATWIEFVNAQPSYWNKDGTMTDNQGLIVDMTAVGTITGPS